jgi:hypothetical protein
LQFKHHSSVNSLENSSDGNCGICRVLYEDLTTEIGGEELSKEEGLETTAYLSLLDEGAYRVDFRLRYNGIRFEHTFILKASGRC